METINDIVREIHKKADLLSIVGEGGDLFELADRIKKAHEFELVVEKVKAAGEGYAAGKQSVTDCNHLETVDLDSRCIYGEVKDGDVGNAAAMREALERLREWVLMDLNENAFIADSSGNYMKLIKGTIEIANAALSAPPRNCDRFADELDAQLAFLNEVWLIFVTKDTMLERDKFENWTEEMKSIYAKWLFAEAKGETEKEVRCDA